MNKISILFFLFYTVFLNAQKSEIQKLYSVLISQYDNAKKIVIKDSTSISYINLNDLDFDQLKNEFNEFENEFENIDIESETFKDFKNQNAQHRKLLNDEFPDDKNVYLITSDERKKIFKNNKRGWDKFYRKHPKSQGIFTFSNIGFNKEKNQALVYYGNQSHYLAGIGYLAYLVKIQNVWKLAGLSELWIS